tara:strand:- start:11 stop:928 length:918 start_codon:yes stop_codon:yes gene_type:complete
MALTKVGKEGITGISNSSDATAITIDSSEKVGIGETSPLGKLHVKSADSGASADANFDDVVIEGSDHTGISILSGTAKEGGVLFGDSDDNNVGFLAYDHNTNVLMFGVNASERMRVDSSGNVLVGTSVSLDTSGEGCKFKNTGSITGTFNTSSSGTSGFHYYNTNGTNNGYRFYVRADGGVYNYSSANYNLSDEREKKNIVDMGSHYEDFKKFKFRDFNYNTEEDSQPKKHGVIAQEVELVNSNLVGEDFKVKIDEDGKDVLRKGLKEEQFVMIGLKTLQETIVKLEGALARIDTLEAEVAKLKG